MTMMTVMLMMVVRRQKTQTPKYTWCCSHYAKMTKNGQSDKMCGECVGLSWIGLDWIGLLTALRYGDGGWQAGRHRKMNDQTLNRITVIQYFSIDKNRIEFPMWKCVTAYPHTVRRTHNVTLFMSESKRANEWVSECRIKFSWSVCIFICAYRSKMSS